MFQLLPRFCVKRHSILGDIDISFWNEKTNYPYKIIAFVGENGCGKTTLLNCIAETCRYQYVFLRQNSMYVGLSNESYKLITGKELYPIQNSEELTGGFGVFRLRKNNNVNNKDACIELLKSLNDDKIIEIYKSNDFDDSKCGGEVTRAIDGNDKSLDLTTLSSGQQEILLKLKILRQAQVATDILLLDEPETSLHPRWQKRIVSLIKDIVADKDGGDIPQMFIATHSERVLESLIKDEDALIVRLYKDDGKIKTETISEMDLRLPIPTFAELDYVVFHILSLEYHDELFNRFLYLINKDSTIAADKRIYKLIKNLYGDKSTRYEKTRIYTVHNEEITTNTIPTYIRDYFHHPNNIKKPTNEELKDSIELMRVLVQYMSKKKPNR